jgi:hypothetical protein
VHALLVSQLWRTRASAASRLTDAAAAVDVTPPLLHTLSLYLRPEWADDELFTAISHLAALPCLTRLELSRGYGEDANDGEVPFSLEDDYRAECTYLAALVKLNQLRHLDIDDEYHRATDRLLKLWCAPGNFANLRTLEFTQSNDNDFEQELSTQHGLSRLFTLPLLNTVTPERLQPDTADSFAQVVAAANAAGRMPTLELKVEDDRIARLPSISMLGLNERETVF